MKISLMVVMLGVFIVGPMRCLADSEKESDLPPVDADKALGKICAAYHTGHGTIQSLTAIARFKGWIRDPEDKEQREITSGTMQLYYSEGKYHLRIAHEKRLQRGIANAEGQVLRRVAGQPGKFLDAAGNAIDIRTNFIDTKPDYVFVVNDDDTIRSTIIPRPARYTWMVRREFAQTRGDIGVDIVDPAYLFGVLCFLEPIIKDAGTESLKVSNLAEGGYRVTYRLKETQTIRVELDALPEDGFNISAMRVFQEGQQLPLLVEEAAWKKVNDQWIVWKRSRERSAVQVRGNSSDKEVVTYYKLDLNSWVDPEAFTIRSMDADWKPRTGPAAE
jgi:hypothetical protein